MVIRKTCHETGSLPLTPLSDWEITLEESGIVQPVPSLVWEEQAWVPMELGPNLPFLYSNNSRLRGRPGVSPKPSMGSR